MPEVLVLVGPLAAAATALATPRLILTCRPPPRLHSARQNGDLPPHGKTAARPCASLAPKGPELCTPMGCEFPPTARASMSHSTFRKKTPTAGQALPLWWAVSGARSERLSNGKPAQIRSCKRHAESRWVWNLTILGIFMANFCELRYLPESRYLPVLPCDVFGRNSHIQTKIRKLRNDHSWLMVRVVCQRSQSSLSKDVKSSATSPASSTEHMTKCAEISNHRGGRGDWQYLSIALPPSSWKALPKAGLARKTQSKASRNPWSRKSELSDAPGKYCIINN